MLNSNIGAALFVADVGSPVVIIGGGILIVVAGLALVAGFVVGGLYLVRRFRARESDKGADSDNRR